MNTVYALKSALRSPDVTDAKDQQGMMRAQTLQDRLRPLLRNGGESGRSKVEMFRMGG